MDGVGGLSAPLENYPLLKGSGKVPPPPPFPAIETMITGP